MKNRIKQILLLIVSGIVLFIPLSCVEEHYVEPKDPFEKERLEVNPAVIHFADNNNPLAMKTNHSNIVETPEGIRIQGSIFTEHEQYGETRLVSGDLIFFKESAASKLGKFLPTEHGNLPITNGTFYRVTEDSIETYSAMAAYGMLELPKLGMLSKITAPLSGGGLAGAKITLGYGSKIKETFGSAFDPLHDDRNYFIFEMETGVSFDIGAVDASIGNALDDGNMSVNAGNGSSYMVALDPLDPYFFYRGNMGGISILGIDGAGFGFSVQGNINYNPSLGIYDRVKSFDNGNIYLQGDIPIPIPGLELLNTTVSGEAVIGFERGDFGAPISFFDLVPVKYIVGLNGSLTLNPDIIPGYLSLTFNLADANMYLNWNNIDDFQFSFAGMCSILDLPNPNVLIVDLSTNVLKKLGLPEGSLEFVKYVRLAAAVQNPASNLKENAIFFGTLSSIPMEWDFGVSRRSWIEIPGIGEIAAGEVSYRLNPSLFRFLGQVDIGPFAGMEILGEIEWANGADFTLKGHSWADIGGEWGPVGFSLVMELLAEIYKRNLTFGFNGLIHLEGKCWADIPVLGKITVGAKFRLEVSIASNGTFKVCFAIGVGPVGYNVCIDYSTMANGYMGETITMKEIPIENVPVEHRFQPEDGQVELPNNYVPDYATEHTSRKMIKMHNVD